LFSFSCLATFSFTLRVYHNCEKETEELAGVPLSLLVSFTAAQSEDELTCDDGKTAATELDPTPGIGSFPLHTGDTSFNTTGGEGAALGPKNPRQIKLFASAEGRTGSSTRLSSTPNEVTSLSLQGGLNGSSTSQGTAKTSLRDTPKHSTGVEENKSSQSLLRKPAGKSFLEGKGETGTGIKATSTDTLPSPNPSLAGVEPFTSESPETFTPTSNPSAADSRTNPDEEGTLTEDTSTLEHDDGTSRPTSEPIHIPFERTKCSASPRFGSKNKPITDFLYYLLKKYFKKKKTKGKN
jgi:hypothetical protein